VKRGSDVAVKRWYANAQNYAMDLESDLARRGFIVDFIRNFESGRRSANAGLAALRFVPRPARKLFTRRPEAAAQKHHFGQPVPLEECAPIFDIATNITRLPCVCRGAMQPHSDAEPCCLVMTVNKHDTLLAEGFRDYSGGPASRDSNDSPKTRRWTTCGAPKSAVSATRPGHS
jgi:hypothetical protein